MEEGEASMCSEESAEDFKPRDYQEELLEIARKRNTILFLPTGSGKTFVAIMLIRHLIHQLKKPYRMGGKRTFFLVNTVPLVCQQADAIQRALPLTVGRFSGDMNVDSWDLKTWSENLQKYEVLVMTSQILLDMLSHCYVTLDTINLLIFDECHHAVDDHPMRQIMQLFEGIDRENQPRILGLTATLLNSNVKSCRVQTEIKNLEVTFQSTIATVDAFVTVAGFSTKPKERIITYEESVGHKQTIAKANQLVEDIQEFLKDCVAVSTPPQKVETIPNATLFTRSNKSVPKLIKSLLEDLKFHLQKLGPCGGGKAALAHLIQVLKLQRRAQTAKTRLYLSSVITTINVVQKELDDYMSDCGPSIRVLKYSSMKILTLIQIIREFKKDFLACKAALNNEQTEHQKEKHNQSSCIIFVQRRCTAKILFYILKDLRELEEFNFLQPDFIIGLNSILHGYETREGMLLRKKNVDVMERFNAGEVNVLVATDVVEEGIDIPQCNMVIKFDEVFNYRSYVQSKGRARHNSSRFFMMVPAGEAHKFETKYEVFQQTEEALRNLLIGRTRSREEPTEEKISSDLYEQEMEPYTWGSCRITLNSAISLVNRYCLLLPQDKFTELVPIWYLSDHEPKAYLQLPINSKIKSIIEGPRMSTKKLAKRAVALEACALLHKAGELDDNLMPCGREPKFLLCPHLFPHWQEDEEVTDKRTIGGKKRKHQYPKKFPAILSNCYPTEGVSLYLHVIVIKPIYERPSKDDTRKTIFYNLLSQNETFAILSTKKLPKVAQGPLYLNVGELEMQVLANLKELHLTSDELLHVRAFHTMIFSQLLKLVKSFMVFDAANLEESYCVVPVTTGTNGCYDIDWQTVIGHAILPDVSPAPDNLRSNLVVTEEAYLETVVIPWYRGMLPEQFYIVTSVCRDMTPHSVFPTCDHESYASYFKAKYGVTIFNDDQPLIEVKAISRKLNCLKPRLSKKVLSKRKRQELQEDFEEHLVPELCLHCKFPSVYWLKSICLPSALHRLSSLLLAEELRLEIFNVIGLGVQTLPEGTEWQPLQEDRSLFDENEEGQDNPEGDMYSNVLNTVKIGGLPNFFKKDPWDGDKHPVDLDRNIEEISLLEIVEHVEFVDKGEPLDLMNTVRFDDVNDIIPLDDEEFARKGSIAILSANVDGLGPQQYEILQALTSQSCNDILNLERLETLGDSFLKFASSLYLFVNYEDSDEGQLTAVKGKMVGNRNLFYLGKRKGLGGMIKVHEFCASSEWVAPLFCVPRDLQDVVREAGVAPNVLYELNIPREEQLCGTMGTATRSAMAEKLLTWEEDMGLHPNLGNFLSIQTVSDKTIADCVEALIGAYLKSCGINGALLFLGWMEVLPRDKVVAEVLFRNDCCPARLPYRHEDIEMHLGTRDRLEETLGYKFRDSSYLLQALSHTSYTSNRITDCYQRLEFIGDAILDFLITCYIYEHCGLLTPGDLTDLRSALVNNSTFAALTIRNGFHKHLLHYAPKLFDKINQFDSFQESRGHAINEEVLLLLEEGDMLMAESVEVPKVLGDLFESLAGAIYLDSGMSLTTVWRVYYNLMKKEIHEFSAKVPKQPVRMLYERCKPEPIFGKSELVPDTEKVMVPLTLYVKGNKLHCYGFGYNKTEAKRAAAKIALKALM